MQNKVKSIDCNYSKSQHCPLTAAENIASWKWSFKDFPPSVYLNPTFFIRKNLSVQPNALYLAQAENGNKEENTLRLPRR